MKPPTALVILTLLYASLTALSAHPAPQAQTTPCPTNIDGQGIVRYIQGLDSIELTLIAGGDRKSVTVTLAGIHQIPPAARDSPRLVDQLRDLVELAPVYVDLRKGEEKPVAVLLVPLNLTHLLNVNAWLLEKAGVPISPECKIIELETLVEGGGGGENAAGGEGLPSGRSFMDFALILLLLFAALVLLVVLVSLYG